MVNLGASWVDGLGVQAHRQLNLYLPEKSACFSLDASGGFPIKEPEVIAGSVSKFLGLMIPTTGNLAKMDAAIAAVEKNGFPPEIIKSFKQGRDQSANFAINRMHKYLVLSELIAADENGIIPTGKKSAKGVVRDLRKKLSTNPKLMQDKGIAAFVRGGKLMAR